MEPNPARAGDQGTDDAGVAVVVPVFNSAATLDELCERIVAALSSVPDLPPWELILVNDGSSDSSWGRIVGLSAEDERVRGVDLTRNFGQHNALLAGIHRAHYEVIVTLDDDLQHPPEEIPRLIDALRPGLDVVYGVPIDRRHPAYRRIGAVAVRRFLLTVTRHRGLRVATGFRAFRSDLAKRLPEDSGRRVVLDPLLRARTRRIGSIPVNHARRRVGRSNYSVRMLVRFALTEIATELPPWRREARQAHSYWVRTVTESQPAGDGQH